MCVCTHVHSRHRECRKGLLGFESLGSYLLREVREVTGLSPALEAFIEFLVAKATMGLLLGDSWGRPKAAQGREELNRRVWESRGGFGKEWDFCIPEGMNNS